MSTCINYSFSYDVIVHRLAYLNVCINIYIIRAQGSNAHFLVQSLYSMIMIHLELQPIKSAHSVIKQLIAIQFNREAVFAIIL